MYRDRHRLRRCVLFGAALCAAIGQARAAESFSEANQILFDTDHLRAITEPTILHYNFKKTAADGSGFNDTIDMTVSEVRNDGTKRVQLRYFSGERGRYAPDVPSALGNPVLILYLQRDVNEMGRLTSGRWRYFQKRIKLALEAADEVSPVSLNFQGRQIKGHEVRIAPYRDDPQNHRYADYREKRYVFTFAQEVPGYVFEIRSVVPAEREGPPLVEEILSYAGQTAVN